MSSIIQIHVEIGINWSPVGIHGRTRAGRSHSTLLGPHGQQGGITRIILQSPIFHGGYGSLQGVDVIRRVRWCSAGLLWWLLLLWRIVTLWVTSRVTSRVTTRMTCRMTCRMSSRVTRWVTAHVVGLWDSVMRLPDG